MRVYVYFFIIIIFGLIGYEIKRKYIEQKNILLFFKSLIEYLKLNITLYKSNVDEIINNYKIMQNNKNAKYINLFLKNDNLKANIVKNINNYFDDKDIKVLIEIYFFNLGKEDIVGENKKAEVILKSIDESLKRINKEIKTKGDLYFKLMLALGVVMVVLLWWVYECFYFI